MNVPLVRWPGCACGAIAAALNCVGKTIAEGPLRAEEKEFLLTARGQSVMNIFTAFGFRFRVQFCLRFL